jgi:hypothetical protein
MPTLALSALAAAAMGCGSSPKPLTRAELTSKADAICRTVTAKLEVATKGGVSSLQAIARLAPKLLAFEQTALVELGKLVPPAELEADWKQFVAGAQALVEYTAKLGEYVSRKETQPIKNVIASASATQKQMSAIAKRNGLKDCQQVA